MFVTDSFVFLHVPKTGGRCIVHALQRILGETNLLKIPEHNTIHHKPLKEIGLKFKNTPKFAFIRNPWDWYVSWYHFQKRSYIDAQHQGDPKIFSFYDIVSNHNTLGFKETIINLLDIDVKMGEEIKQLFLKDIYMNTRRGHRVGDIDAVINNKDGFYSKRVNTIAPYKEEITWGRAENLNSDLVRILSKYVTLDDSQINKLLTMPKENTSDRGDYRDYYDDELINLVAEKDKSLIEHFEYTYE